LNWLNLSTPIIREAMTDIIFLLVKVVINHTHVQVHEAINELQQKAVCLITETENVKIGDVTIMQYNLKS
jgi:hypothetical protein